MACAARRNVFSSASLAFPFPQQQENAFGLQRFVFVETLIQETFCRVNFKEGPKYTKF